MLEYFESTMTQSQERAGKILPLAGSEDVRHILGISQETPSQEVATEKSECLPNEKLEWVLSLRPIERTSITQEKLAKVFSRRWLQKFGHPTIYGKGAETGRWTYATCGDSPESFTELKVAWDYFQGWDDGAPTANFRLYKKRWKATRSRFRKFTRKFELEENLTFDKAAERSLWLKDIVDRFDGCATLILKATDESCFAGRDVWDVMLCLGLRWGNMDLFHWDNEDHELGGDSHFSVGTSTQPGYFLPEKISANRLDVEDLIFSFSIPRSADPVGIFEKMYAAMHYAQKRLGGELSNHLGDKLDAPNKYLEEIGYLAKILTDLGFEPGDQDALRLF